MRLLLLCLVFAFLPMMVAQQPVRAQRWNIFSLVHPDTRLLIGVDWRRVVESPMGPTLLRQVRMGGHPLLDFLESIDNVDKLLVSTPGAGDEGRSLLVIGEGRFTLARVRAMAKADGAVSRRYNEVELLVPPGASNADLHFALLDAQTILFGDGASVKNAIDRWQRQDSSYAKNAILARALVLQTSNEIWVVAENLPETLAAIGLGEPPIAEQVEMIEAAISTAQALSAQVTIRAISEESVAMLSAGLPTLLQLAALGYSDQPFLSQVARKLRVVTEKKYLKMGVSIEPKLFEQSMAELRLASATAAQQLASAAPAVHSRSAPVPSPAALAAPVQRVPERRTIRIVTEDGVREIPYGKP